MILNPKAKKVLCYGDSLTWGNHFGGNRFLPEQRWTYMLQEKLWDWFDVMEEGLRSRTTNMDDPENLGRNWFTYFGPCIESGWELNVLILLLGTNDSKQKFQLSAADILKNIELYVEFLRNYNDQNGYRKTEMILMSPPQINVPYLTKDSYDARSNEILRELSILEAVYCSVNDLHFVDTHGHCIGNEHDWVHLDVGGNHIISDLLFQKIRTIHF